MKKIVKKVVVYSMVGLLNLGLGASVIEASPWHDNRDNQRYEQPDRDYSMPFKWHERRENFAQKHHRMERIHDRAFTNRFAGLHSYRWHDRHGEGFWYHGHRITDAVFFYNDADELVSIGFMHEGVFIRINADCGEERNHDHFFF